MSSNGDCLYLAFLATFLGLQYANELFVKRTRKLVVRTMRKWKNAPMSELNCDFPGMIFNQLIADRTQDVDAAIKSHANIGTWGDNSVLTILSLIF